jgi:hypothetical protein
MHERGSTLVEWAVVGPMITLLGALILQYALIFHAKNLINHAGHMAAREGSMAHAQLAPIESAYLQALIPLYGGGTDSQALAKAQLKAHTETAGYLRIERLNPTAQGFDDWADPTLAARYGGRRVLNLSEVLWADDTVGPASGQDRRDAQLLKLRFTHGHTLSVPLARRVILFVMRWHDDGQDPFRTHLLENDRLPIVMHATVPMLSDAVEQTAHNTATSPEPIPPAQPPPTCLTAGCSVITSPETAGGGPGTPPASGSPAAPADPVADPDPTDSCPPGDPDCALLCPGA